MENQNQRRGRGPGKKPTLTHVSLRIPAEVVVFFKSTGRASHAMRQVLEDYVKKHLDTR